MFVAGLLGHLFWSAFVWNHVYYSPDYVVDFWMLRPASEKLLHVHGWPTGHLIDSHSAEDIFRSWLLLASACWVAAAALFCWPLYGGFLASRTSAIKA